MTATDELRRLLTEHGIEYGRLGQYNTRTTDDLEWLAEDNFDGTLNLTAFANHLAPDEALRLITGPTTTMTSVCDEDGVGHSTCDNCGRTVARWLRYCPWCGCRFVHG